MDDLIRLGSVEYWILLAALVFGRGMDFLSTWVATPGLLLEANPLARRLGWKGGIALNLFVCAILARWPVPAIAVTTTSLLVASRNFKSAVWMRALGEHVYLCWVSDLFHRAGAGLFLACLIGETGLVGLVGALVMWVAGTNLVVLSVGLGIVAYAIAVAFYSALSIRKLRSLQS